MTRTVRYLALLGALLGSASALPAQGDATSKTLAPPKALWAAQTSPTQVTLQWEPTPGATGYKVFAFGIGGGGERLVTTIGQLLVPVIRTVVPLIPGAGQIVYYVVGIDRAGQVSMPAKFNTISPVAKSAVPGTIPPPSSVTAAETAPGVVTVTWNAVPGATAYFIGRAVHPNGFRTVCQLCPTETRYVDSAVTAGARHMYTIGAVTPNGTSRRTNSNDVTPATGKEGTGTAGTVAAVPPLAGPTNAKAVLKGSNTVQLTWTAPAIRPAGFRISRVVNGVARVIATVGGVVTEFVDLIPEDVLRIAGSFSYNIEAIYSKGASAPVPFDKAVNLTAAVDSAATLPPRGVTNPKATVTGTGAVALSWQTAAGATAYRILRSLDGGKVFTLIATLTGNTLTYVDTTPNLLKQSPRYQIVSVNAKGASAPVPSGGLAVDAKAASP